MKHMKKVLAFAMALMMLMSLALTVSAADDSYTIKLSGSATKPTEGHTYTVYQIFTGTLSLVEGQKILSDVVYGANYTPGETQVGDDVPDSELEAITDARAFADKLVSEDLLEGTYGVLNEGNAWTLEEVPAGYYLIVDTTEVLPEGHTRSQYIVQVVDDITMKPKGGVVDVIKKVKDINDSEDAEIGDNAWTDTADHDIGDIVPYEIKSNISEIADFATYKVAYNDVMSKGLTYNNDAKITMTYNVVGGETKEIDVTDAFTITSKDYDGTDEKYQGGKVYTFACEDLKALVAEEGNLVNATITIDYTCTLNSDAQVGAAGNPNKVNLEYTREYDEEEPGVTPWDVNIVFTYRVDVNKVDSEGKPLTGAEFRLEKFVADENGTEEHNGVKGNWEPLELAVSEDGTKFSFKGLDDGYYRITETVAPEGYNKIDVIYFTVSADHTVDPEELQLIDLQATQSDADKETGAAAEFTVELEAGALETDIVNEAGVELPSTGGIGTTIFYIVGGLLAAAAVVLLVTKKRMAAK